MIGIETIRTGANSWIGNVAVVMANVGAHWVVGAGSVGLSDIPDWSVVGGNPARILRVRTIEPMSPGVV